IPSKVILGACRPQLAHQMLAIDSRLAALLPCNVVVSDEGGETLVEIVDPMAMATLADDVAALAVARDARCRLSSIIEKISESEDRHAVGA
ncbi:MAG TPA: DUF302 domain-containing protein, partial [Marmoricola sp.]|nr:DUF302 domain-containing protein [Marmoricola sp.]